jgi:hypothetical protein
MSAAHLRGSRGLAPETPRRSEGWVPPSGQSGAQPPRRRQAVEEQAQLVMACVVRY